ncbi:DUF3883 domain-containing protein [Bisbaumannia pacifica]|uniref:DUF3883 domain-containing protein n=1 Tax=Bisbaumannia pacifica TaxID=77098 RepID=A0ABD4L5Y2_9GAMM|nr:DUF3883 domain-containing protein [Halomonas pacifica]MBH8581648.1 DUF3883 domain-containing protein [Halomonas pacifica]
METITTRALAERLAGGDSYIRTKGGEVKGLAVTTGHNPEAPEVIVVGNRPRVVANAERLMACDQAVPVYIKQAVEAWAYRGEFRATTFSRDPEVIERYRRHRPAEGIAGILFLEEVVDADDSPGGGGWSTDPARRKAVEEAAVEKVWAHYRAEGYAVESHEAAKCGYDLLATRGDEALRIEVKGTAGAEPTFWLTRNERAASVHPCWRLALVTEALSDAPSAPRVYTASEMAAAFHLEPQAWRATPKPC